MVVGETYGDSGSASRFFYTAKASQEERNLLDYILKKNIASLMSSIMMKR